MLVYKLEREKLVLLLVATGSHDDIFRNSRIYR
ncbi:hypothetical protein [Ruoffia tabacinasalis]|nr:hypothetical protein [Ruoffia tabacinasalis]